MITFKFATKDDMPELTEAAKSDNHGVIAATHLVKKDGKVVGYVSFNAMPNVLIWMHSQRTNVRDALQVENFFETLAAPFGSVCVPVPKTSPFHPLMTKKGYQDMGEGTVFMKPL